MSLKKGTKDVSLLTKIPPNVAPKTITTNGAYVASDEGLDGYSEVNVETAGVDINEYFNLTKRTSGNCKYYIKKLPVIDTSDYTSFTGFFESMIGLEEIPAIDTGKGTGFYRFMYFCNSVKKIPMLDWKSAKDIDSWFQTGNNYVNLDYFGGFKDVGNAFSTDISAEYNSYRIIIGPYIEMPHDSLMNVINNLYDIKTKGVQPQKLVLGTTNLAKLTSEEIAIATEKGWTVS